MGEGWVEILHRVDTAELDFVAGDAEALKSLWSHADEVVVMGAAFSITEMIARSASPRCSGRRPNGGSCIDTPIG